MIKVFGCLVGGGGAACRTCKTWYSEAPLLPQQQNSYQFLSKLFHNYFAHQKIDDFNIPIDEAGYTNC
jgi:hypothetical protein